jgi:hypothetical protein
MTGPDRPAFHLEITEDSKDGISIRLKHSGHLPNVLAGIPKDVLRRARPWFWNSHERKILNRAISMNWRTFRVVHDTLLLERAKIVMANRPRAKGPPRLSWLEKRRLDRAYAAKLKEMTPTEQITRNVALSMRVQNPDGIAYNQVPKAEPTLTEQMRDLTRTALSSPKPAPPRSRSR